MQSTPNLRDNDPHDVFVIEPDLSLAARVDKAPLDLLYDVLSRPADPAPSQLRPDPQLRIAPDFSASVPAPPVDAAAHAVDDDIQLGDTEISAHRPPTGKFARRAVMGLFALGSAMGAAAWQHYGDDAKAMMANWTPAFALASSVTPSKSATSEPPAAAPDPAAATDQAAVQPAPSVGNTSPDQTQVIQSMARDLAAMGQQISELKATVEQLKAGQQQAASAPARATEARLAEPAPRARIAPPPPPAPVHAAVTPVRKPKQVFPYAPIAPAAPPPPQTAAVAAPAPMQIAPLAEAADGGPVVRPPLPLR